MMRCHLILFFALLTFVSLAQEQEYFNNIYQQQNNFAIGMTVLETEDGYIGYGGTESPSIGGQMILFYKINKQGEELIWKTFGEDSHSYYYGNVGGAMVKTFDGNYAMACHNYSSGLTYASLFKLDSGLDTIWKKDFNLQTYTIGVNCIETIDNGLLITGYVWESGPDSDVLLIKTNSDGELEWYQIYDDELVQQGTNTIETPDGGYLIGGLNWNAAVYHTMDAMIIKTDSLGNEQWTQYYGNPDVDDDMAHVLVADDGNYLVATVYGKWSINPANGTRAGRVKLLNINDEGNVIWDNEIGPTRNNIWIKNFRNINDGYILSGFSSETDTATFQYYSGWVMKLDNNFDSIWYRDYVHNVDDWDNMLYDASPTSDNGYIVIGQARPDIGGSTNKMWVVKVDSMGCDTPGCATGVWEFELPEVPGGELTVWPNPTNSKVTLSLSKCEQGSVEKTVRIYNSHGLKLDEVKVPEQAKFIEINVSKYKNGLYYLQLISYGQVIGTLKLIKNEG